MWWARITIYFFSHSWKQHSTFPRNQSVLVSKADRHKYLIYIYHFLIRKDFFFLHCINTDIYSTSEWNQSLYENVCKKTQETSVVRALSRSVAKSQVQVLALPGSQMVQVTPSTPSWVWQCLLRHGEKQTFSQFPQWLTEVAPCLPWRDQMLTYFLNKTPHFSVCLRLFSFSVLQVYEIKMLFVTHLRMNPRCKYEWCAIKIKLWMLPSVFYMNLNFRIQ